MATFVVANFVAHAATVKSVPGELAVSASWTLILALLFPVSTKGSVPSINAQCSLIRHRRLQRGQELCVWSSVLPNGNLRLEKFLKFLTTWVRVNLKKLPCRSQILSLKVRKERGSLVVMNGTGLKSIVYQQRVRVAAMNSRLCSSNGLFDSNFQRNGKEQEFSKVPALVVEDKVYAVMKNSAFRPPSSIMGNMDCRKVYGICQLPEGYALPIVPPGAQVDEHQCSGKAPCNSELSSKYQLAKSSHRHFSDLIRFGYFLPGEG